MRPGTQPLGGLTGGVRDPRSGYRTQRHAAGEGGLIVTEQPQMGSSTDSDGGIDPSGGGVDNGGYHGYSVDDETQPQSTGDSLVDDERDVDPMEEGWNPPEKWSVAQGYGNTPLEEELGETLDQRVAQEIPEPDPYQQAESEEIDPETGELIDPDAADAEVGDARAGRLVEPNAGVGEDEERTLIGEDAGIDGAAATAEEAAVHVIDDDAV